MRIALVAEGETDVVVLEAAIAAVLGARHHASDFVLQVIQPERSRGFGDAGPHGGGWKGVRGKCSEIAERGGPQSAGLLANADLLVVHLDGEVAQEAEIACAKPCPPAAATADALRARMLAWLGMSGGDGRIILVVPMKELEAWLVPILRPGDKFDTPSIECRDKPSSLFAGGTPRLVRSERKRLALYRQQAATITEKWSLAPAKLLQAQRFEDELLLGLANVTG